MIVANTVITLSKGGPKNRWKDEGLNDLRQSLLSGPTLR
jgi:hypothetical protein